MATMLPSYVTEESSRAKPFYVASLLRPEVLSLLEHDPGQLQEILKEVHPADLSYLTTTLPEEAAHRLLSVLPPELSADVAEYLEDYHRTELLGQMLPADAADILEEMAADERADLLGDLDDTQAEAILEEMEDEEAHEARDLLRYDETSAGGLMTTEFVRLVPGLTAREALSAVHSAARQERETVYACFVVDEQDRLEGVLGLRSILAAEPDAPLDEVMDRDIISVSPTMDQEEVAKIIARYDLLAVPVLGPRRRILGIITVDDVLDVLVEEGTEDLHKMGAVAPMEEPYLRTPFWEMVWKRGLWLLVLFVGQMFTGTALQHYHASIASSLALVYFIPMIISSGGNSGSQSSTLVIRGMAVGEIRPAQVLPVLKRELLTGLALGSVLAVFGFTRSLLWGTSNPMAGVVALTLLAVVTLGAVIGAGMPILLSALRIDPAITSSPLIASLLDVIGLVVYFEIALRLLAP